MQPPFQCLLLLYLLISSPATWTEGSQYQDLQFSPPPPDYGGSLPMVLTLMFLFFFLIGFFSIYVCRCIMKYAFSHPRRHRHGLTTTIASQSTAPATEPHGLDPTILATFPTFAYSFVKDLRIGKNGLECAVCLSEFADDDVLRLLPVCSHAFHPECIDLWLASHTTCPVCRFNLDEQHQQQQQQQPPQLHPPSPGTNAAPDQQSDSSGRNVSFKESEREGGDGNNDGSVHDRGVVVQVELYPRSHSTGHSLILNRGDGFPGSGGDDRFTLRLPENVKERITRDRNWTSCVTFGDWIRGVEDSNGTAGGQENLVTGNSGGLTVSVGRPLVSRETVPGASDAEPQMQPTTTPSHVTTL